MTKAQLIAAIDAYITANGNNEITGTILNGVLQDFVETVWGDDDGIDGIGKFKGLAITTTNPTSPDENEYYIAKYNALSDQVFTYFGVTVYARELTILKYSSSVWTKQSIGAFYEGQTVTAAEIRDALESLTGSSRLSKASIMGADFALNYQGEIDFEDLPTIAGYVSQQGDFFICDLGGESTTYRNGDWAICLEEDNYSNFPTHWLILPFGSILELTGEDVRDALETLSGTNRLEKDYIYGAEMALNWRGTGDVNAPSYKAGMTNIKKGDFWIYDFGEATPESTVMLGVGDWIIAVKDGASIVSYNSTTDWYIFKVTREDVFQSVSLVGNKIDFDGFLSNKLKYDRSAETGTKTINSFGKGKAGQQKTLWIRNRVVPAVPSPSTKLTCTALGSNGIFIPGVAPAGSVTWTNTIADIFITAVCITKDQWIVVNIATSDSATGPKAGELIEFDTAYTIDFYNEGVVFGYLVADTEFDANIDTDSVDGCRQTFMIKNVGGDYDLTFNADFDVISGVYDPREDRINIIEMIFHNLTGVEVVIHNDYSRNINGELTVGDGGTTNYAKFDNKGHLTFHGTARPWRDQLADGLSLQVQGTGITKDNAEGVVNFLTSADLNDYLVTNVQLNHDKDLAASIYPHIHFIQVEDHVPNFLLQYRWQINGGAKVTVWTNLKCNNLVHDFPDDTIHQIAYSDPIAPITGSQLSDIVQFRIIRDNDDDSEEFGAEDAYTASAAMLSFDVHFMVNSLGSDDQYD